MDWALYPFKLQGPHQNRLPNTGCRDCHRLLMIFLANPDGRRHRLFGGQIGPFRFRHATTSFKGRRSRDLIMRSG